MKRALTGKEVMKRSGHVYGLVVLVGLLVVSVSVPAFGQCETKLVASDDGSGDDFGTCTSISGDRLVIGAPDDDDVASNAGAVYVFHLEGGTWIEEAKLTASDGASSDDFGTSCAISGDFLVVGAPFDDDAGSSSGSAYVFERQGARWVERAKLLPLEDDGDSDGGTSDQFGFSVGIDGDTVVVGAHLNDDNGSSSGSAYVYQRNGLDWDQQAKLLPGDGAASDEFARSVSISGDTIVAGAHLDDDQGSNAGKAYVFVRDGSDWSEQDQLLGTPGGSGDEFGYSVSISGEFVVVGAREDDDNGSGSGSAFVFHREGSVWVEVAQLLASDGSSSDEFGNSVSIRDEWILVGAPDEDEQASNAGAVYVYRQEGEEWIELAKSIASDGASSDAFGESVAVSNEFALAGAIFDDDGGSSSGSAYTFDLASVGNITAGMTYPTIQAAIDAAQNGDVIAASACTFFENVDFLGKTVTVRSGDPTNPDVVASTIIDGGGNGTVVTLAAGQLTGFTIQNGDSPGNDGGGVQATGTAVVSFNVITGNVAIFRGGGVTAKDFALIHNNQIIGNTGIVRGGGINARNNAIVVSNLIQDNFAGTAGGGVWAREDAIIRNNTITGNSTNSDPGGDGQIIGGGGIVAEGASIVVNNLIVFSAGGSGLNVAPGEAVVADYNCVFGNVDGEYEADQVGGPNDINVDPQLEGDGIHLGLVSPCIHTGDPTTVAETDERDFDGFARIVGGRVDIGVDEARDCNGNAVIDSFDIFVGISEDLDDNGIPDECQEDCDGDGTVDPTDCNDNFLLDECEIVAGTASDCNANGIPDECEEDCNANLKPDDCDIAGGIPDCNANGIPDSCDLDSSFSIDCDVNQVPDECEIAAGTAMDCNLNGGLDVCELYLVVEFAPETAHLGPIGAGSSQSYTIIDAPEALADVTLSFSASADLVAPVELIDIEINSVFVGSVFVDGATDCPFEPDEDQLVISAETYNSAVGGGDAVIEMLPSDEVDADLCEPESFIEISVTYEILGTGQDCNLNLSPDECDIDDGISQDCDTNGVPDECEQDCNENGIGDACDISGGTSLDCNFNAIPDSCEDDCNGNGIPDDCDLTAGTSTDCNGNGTPDECPPDTLFGATSRDFAPLEINVIHNFILSLPPGAQGDVTLTFNAIGDLDGDGESEFLDIEVNGVAMGSIFDGPGEDCGVEQTDQLIISSFDYNSAVFGGDAIITMIPHGINNCTGSFINVNISYVRFDEGDCNGSGMLDICDLEAGTVLDCNSNLIPDECDVATGRSEDCNANGLPDECDIEPTVPGVTFKESDPAVMGYIDISETGTALNLGDDQVTEVVMPFVTHAFPSGVIQISNNGALGFNGILSLSSINVPIPTTDAFGGVQALFPFWDDLDSDTGNVYVETLCPDMLCGTTICGRPNRIFVVEWRDRPHFPGDSILNGNEVTFQVQIFETPVDNVVAQFLYLDTDFMDQDLDDAASATVGYQTDSGTGAQWSFNEGGAVSEVTILSVIAPSISIDQNANGVPDECETRPVANETQGTQFFRIQAAITEAVDGDVIRVKQGRYFGNIDFLGKDIILRSTNPLRRAWVAGTIIDGQCKGTVVRMSTGVLDGFTIQNGAGSGDDAAGVHATGNAVVIHNEIHHNSANNDGGGVGAFDDVLVQGNRIYRNTAAKFGGGINARGNAVVIDNIVDLNQAGTAGAGIHARDNALIRNNTVVNNSTSGSDGGPGSVEGGGGIAAEHTSTILNNIIAFSFDGAGLNVEGSSVTSNFNCFFGNADGALEGDAELGPGDITLNPNVNPQTRRLLDNSPCIGRGDPNFESLEDETDVDGEPRVSGDRVDIGADEAADCNSNRRGDASDIDQGLSEDLNGNGIPDECEEDCNDNGVPDDLDISEGTSIDCDANGVPDECEADCNDNGIADACDIAEGTSLDCNGNEVPDECEDCNDNGVADECDITEGTSLDCNANGLPDECEDCNGNFIADECDISEGTSEDCNANTVPDECDIAGGTSLDCNGNSTPDSCDIASGTSADCDGDGEPDECGDDCNDNGINDGCDIVEGTSADCNTNSIPDECDVAEGTSPDCNINGVPDSCDLSDGTSSDCNVNGLPDECDVASGTAPDCNGNDLPDECDLAGGTSMDCNINAIPDSCDIEGGTSADCNANTIPDSCDIEGGTTRDCNLNGVPDDCDVSGGTSMDVDGNGIPDECAVQNVTQGINYADIQSAIDAAAPSGDDIEVAPGTYVENIDFLDKNIDLHSFDPLDASIVGTTIINGGGLDTVVTMSVGRLDGFTIVNGNGLLFNAGGVHATGTAVVTHNNITNNIATNVGGGVTAEDFVVVSNNLIGFNFGGSRGGGVNARNNALIIDNYVAFNGVNAGGGGIRAREDSTIRNNTLVFNSSLDGGGTNVGGGGILAEDNSVVLSNIFAFSTDGAGIHIRKGHRVTADYNCVFDNLDGEYSGDAVAGPNDVNADPEFDDDDLHLLSSSPCIDAGDPDLAPEAGETDIDNEDRIAFARVDIGCDETQD